MPIWFDSDQIQHCETRDGGWVVFLEVQLRPLSQGAGPQLPNAKHVWGEVYL